MQGTKGENWGLGCLLRQTREEGTREEAWEKTERKSEGESEKEREVPSMHRHTVFLSRCKSKQKRKKKQELTEHRSQHISAGIISITRLLICD